MLMPKRTKFRKVMKGRNRGKSFRGNKIEFGEFAFEAARITMTREMKRQGKSWIRVFPDKPLTRKPLETRMGKGKGSVEEWVMNIKPGRIIFEVAGVSEEISRTALTLALHKLPFKCKIITAKDSNEIY